jgi:ATP-dependent helicase/nuclease subunit B
VAGLPGPFEDPLTAASLARAQMLMKDITDAAFAADERHSFGTRAWRYRWQQLIPRYLDWQLQRSPTWQVKTCEQRHERRLDDASGLVLIGKLDRIDHDGEGCAIIDYKTGALPKPAEIESGEQIQLPFYALLAETPVKQALYLQLTELSAQHGARLVTLYRQLRSGVPMPAWGDRLTCERCQMAGLCRKEYWQPSGVQ